MAIALALSMTFISGVMAQQASPPSSTPSAPANAPAKLEKFSGTIERVDAAGKEIVVKNGKKEMTFSSGDQTKFMEGKKELSFTDLTKGMHVTVQYKKAGEKRAAEKVNVSMAKTAHKSASSPKNAAPSEKGPGTKY